MHARAVDGPDAHDVQSRLLEGIADVVEARMFLLLHRVGFDLAHACHVVVEQTVHGAAGLAHRPMAVF